VAGILGTYPKHLLAMFWEKVNAPRLTLFSCLSIPQMLGNLARPSYVRSTEGIWPWSHDQCGTSEEAMDNRKVQKLSNCRYGKGRGSPEIDIIEAQPGDFVFSYENVTQVDNTTRNIYVERPIISSSLQVSPGVSSKLRPVEPNLPEEGEWYQDLFPMGGPAYGEDKGAVASSRTFNSTNATTATPRMINNYWYGQLVNDDPPVWQDGLSCNWHHGSDFYTKQVVLRTEWQTGTDDGYVRWFNGDELIFEVTADTLKSKPGAADAIAQIPYEAMYLILNTDVSPRWGWNGCNPTDPCMLANPGMCSSEGELLCRDCADPACLRCPETTGWLVDFCNDINPERPAEYKIDYIRVYQDTDDPTHTLGCSPPDFPTKQYIDQNWDKYTFDPYVKKEPLLTVQHGGGACKSDADCGNLLASDVVLSDLHDGDVDWQKYIEEFGGPLRQSYCVASRCSCPDDWTGPNCHSPCIGEYAKCEAPTSSSKMMTTRIFTIMGIIGVAALF
jgi:hypothetical protein